MKPLMQRRANGDAGNGSPAPPIVHDVLRSPGHSLNPATRDFMESRFGHDFSQVRVHSDARAAESARAVNARAYTVGRDVVFGSGQYAPGTNAGQRLLAHELAHTIQQGASGIRQPQSQELRRFPLTINRLSGPALQRDCPTGVVFNLGVHPVHVPPCGSQAVTAQVEPNTLTGFTWSLHDSSATVDSGTTIAEDGEITISDSQSVGDINVRATVPPTEEDEGCYAEAPLQFRSHPTGITSTRTVGPPPNPANEYGGVFDHVFTSNDGDVTSLEGVAVGERFPNIPNPTAAVHANIPTPFGPFTLHTATLTSNATNNWFLTAAGELGGTHDQVTFEKNGVNVGDFLLSTSNPSPTHALPASFTLEQDLHWYCRRASGANRWSQFVQVEHIRGLRQSTGDVEFFTSVHGEERPDTYEGPPGILNARATPNRVTRSPGSGPPNTVTIRTDTLPDPMPTGHDLQFSIQGNSHGSSVDANSGEFEAGPNPGTVRVRVRDSQSANPNFDETTVTIV